MTNHTVLIAGAGIAGPTLAYWLERRGFTPTLVEQAAAPRTGGYMIDFWGIGWDVAERMMLLPELERTGYRMEELRLVNDAGERVAGFDGRVFRSALDAKFISVLRGDLASGIYAMIDGQIETIFSDSVQSIRQDADGVDVTFERSEPRRFDLVVGADGLHSAVRARAFGEEHEFERYLGYGTASFTSSGYAHRDEGVYVSHCAPGRQVARYSLRDDRTAFFFVFTEASRQQVAVNDEEPKNVLRTLFGDSGWEASEIIEAMDACDDLYCDRVSQIRMESWSNGRVALVGDACFCPSLLAGQGSAFAMAGAYVLAGELEAAGGDPAMAFERYQSRFKPFIDSKQKAATRIGGWFAPESRFGIWLRNTGTNMVNSPLLAGWLMKRFIDDSFELPDYAH